MVDEPTVLVVCDKCGEQERYEMTALARRAYDMRHLEKQLESEGWHLSDGLDGETICSDCAEK